MPRLLSLKLVTILLATAVTVWMFWAATGSRYSGDAKLASDIPLVGKMLGQLDIRGAARYQVYEHPHGGGTVYLETKVTAISLAQLCDNEGILTDADAINILPRQSLQSQVADDWPWSDKPEMAEDSMLLVGITPRFLHFYGWYNWEEKQLYCKIHFDGTK